MAAPADRRHPVSVYYERTTCPRCQRIVCVRHARYAVHRVVEHVSGRCRMSGLLVPVTGLGPDDHERRALLITDLAAQVQDEDPYIVWDYLTAVPAAEVQRLLMIALAAVPTNGRLDDIFAWVTQLPAAQHSQEIPV